MPLLKYFTIVGAVLLGLLFIADAMIVKPKHPVFASKFDETGSKLLASIDGRRNAQPEPPHIAEVPVEPVVATPAPPPAKVAKVQQAETKTKKVHVARRHPKAEPTADSWDDNARDDFSWRSTWDNDARRQRNGRDAFAYAPRQQNFWFR